MLCMTTVPDRARVRLPGISSRAYEHPADRSALVALRKLTGFDALFRRLASLFSDRSLRLLFLANSVRVSQEQFPQLYQLLLDGASILDLPEVPEMYVCQDYTLLSLFGPPANAAALGSWPASTPARSQDTSPLRNHSSSARMNARRLM